MRVLSMYGTGSACGRASNTFTSSGTTLHWCGPLPGAPLNLTLWPLVEGPLMVLLRSGVLRGNCLTTIDTGSQVCALEWNKHHKEILSAHGLEENVITLWSYPSLRKIVDLRGHKDRVLHLTQSPDGSMVALVSADETI